MLIEDENCQDTWTDSVFVYPTLEFYLCSESSFNTAKFISTKQFLMYYVKFSAFRGVFNRLEHLHYFKCS